jgi:hypothetical protein
MNDQTLNDPNPNDPHGEPNPQHELASAYLDSDAGPEVRAQVESSAVLLSLVDSFSQLRSELGTVPAAPSAARDAALAAAFAEFDAANAPARPAVADTPAATVTSLSSRRRWTGPLLSAAAAVLLVGVAGAAILNGRGDDSKTSSATEAPADLELAAADTQSAPAADSPVSTIGSITGGGAVATVIDTPEQLQALALPTAPLPAVESTFAGSTTVAGDTQATAAASETTVGSDEGAADTTAKIAAGGAPVTGALACLSAQQVFLADIMYQGTFAIAARDTVTGVTQAITDDCTVLATVGP